MSKATQINQVLHSYFEENKAVQLVLAKDMMPYFILAGVFEKDTKNGLPIINVLKRLDFKNQLVVIPFAIAERKTASTKWYFQRVKFKIEPKKTLKKENNCKR
ncbi:hypothetical protein RCH18_003066 [Flavobacterium sp. PL11]|uniref:hypothetical protein n=1 Tax=Flavobacterium sp. PL11 TaxID=3071717 RepID=UPI002E0C9F38|nr:hypothetical protein [Flavobacterium sp. PL11]